MCRCNLNTARALGKEIDCIATYLGATEQTMDACRGLPAANREELMLDERTWYGGEFVERVKRWRNFPRESMHERMQVAGSCESWWTWERR